MSGFITKPPRDFSAAHIHPVCQGDPKVFALRVRAPGMRWGRGIVCSSLNLNLNRIQISNHPSRAIFSSASPPETKFQHSENASMCKFFNFSSLSSISLCFEINIATKVCFHFDFCCKRLHIDCWPNFNIFSYTIYQNCTVMKNFLLEI